MTDSFVHMIETMEPGESTVYIALSPIKTKKDIEELVKSLAPKQFSVVAAQYSYPSENKVKFTITRVE